MLLELFLMLHLFEELVSLLNEVRTLSGLHGFCLLWFLRKNLRQRLVLIWSPDARLAVGIGRLVGGGDNPFFWQLIIFGKELLLWEWHSWKFIPAQDYWVSSFAPGLVDRVPVEAVDKRWDVISELEDLWLRETRLFDLRVLRRVKLMLNKL